MRDNLAADFLFEMFLGLCGFGFMMGKILAADYTDYTDFRFEGCKVFGL